MSNLPPHIALLQSAIADNYAIFQKVIAARLGEFGAPWVERFEGELQTLFDGDRDAIARAADGYCAFSLEAMRLQARFDITKTYAPDSYDKAVEEVYGNETYMVNTYLPALLLSHYLWPHHYRQLLWTHEHFIAPLKALDVVRFCDVGIGTGFYSKELLAGLDQAQGWGFDISPSSLVHTRDVLQKWRLDDRYTFCPRHVARLDDGPEFNAFVTVELLEHLEDPQAFLRELRGTVASGALGLITAAIDAPNRDHIYLYRDNESIAAQIEVAGFEIVQQENFAAYIPASEQETAPQSGCFVVRA